MFGFLRTKKGRMLANAGNWLEVAERVWHYRRDELDESERKDLLGRTEALRKAKREKAEPEKVKLLIEALEETLRHVGGTAYRRSSLTENVEFFLVAAIVILGIRTYFVQPFKIPTNSMWPSYYGMTPEVYRDPADAPGVLMRAARFVLFGARHYQLVAPQSGSITVPVIGDRIFFNTVSGRRWIILPAQFREYVFYVNDVAVRVRVPYDFDFDIAFRDAFGMSADDISRAASESVRANGPIRYITVGKRAEQGQPFLSFDVLTGDQLFVDRLSYHFMRPRVGQGFVFRTGNIPRIAEQYGDQYYIKRLVGVPGDTLEIRQPVLYRNGKPIEGDDAFEMNATRSGLYGGYLDAPEDWLQLRAGETATVPEHSFLALGDNSGNSSDGRYWGFVPEADVVGKPLFIYYPFTRRWGHAP